MSESLENVPLREVCSEAERLTRELIDHLERNLIPKTRELHDLVKPDSPFNTGGKQVKDVTVRNQTSTLLESHKFTEELLLKTRTYLERIEQTISQ